MPRRAKLNPTVPPHKLIGKRVVSTNMFRNGEWSQEVEVDGVRYRCGVSRGKSVRIAFRGSQRGFQWVGWVSRADVGRIWSGIVPGSLGVRGLLIDAGVIVDVEQWWRSWIWAWRGIGGAYHHDRHPKCPVNRFDQPAGRVSYKCEEATS